MKITLEEQPDIAINKVLEAEKQTALAIQQCQTQAETLLEQAREKARIIKAKANSRIHKIHSLRETREQIFLQDFIQQEKSIKQQDIHKFNEPELLEKIVEYWLETIMESEK